MKDRRTRIAVPPLFEVLEEALLVRYVKKFDKLKVFLEFKCVSLSSIMSTLSLVDS